MGRTTTVRELQGAERIETREEQATNEVDAMLFCTHALGLVPHRKKVVPVDAMVPALRTDTETNECAQ